MKFLIRRKIDHNKYLYLDRHLWVDNLTKDVSWYPNELEEAIRNSGITVNQLEIIVAPRLIKLHPTHQIVDIDPTLKNVKVDVTTGSASCPRCGFISSKIMDDNTTESDTCILCGTPWAVGVKYIRVSYE